MASVFRRVSILWQQPKASTGAYARMGSTADFSGFMPIMPGLCPNAGGFTLSQWRYLLSIVFLSNIIANVCGCVIGDRIGHRRTMALMGGLVCAVSTSLFFVLPLWFPGN